MKIRMYAQILLVGAALGIIFWTLRESPWTPVRETGALLVVIGFLGWAAARIEIGTSFAIRARAKELVTRGIYAKVRNPIYVFGSITATGVIFLVGRPRWLVLLLVLVPVQMWRARIEGRVLEAKFGETYREYRRKSWF